ILYAWDIGEGRDANHKWVRMDMSGRANARATLEWDPARGVRMEGHADVDTPRWHGAIMDHLQADVSIDGDELRIDNIEGVKDQGRADGSLWLTWKDVPAGQDEIDMRYRAFDLPIQEGLRAADIGDLPISGQGSGSVRIHGPYSHLRLEAGATARNASVYGLKIPAGSGEMDYDITGDRITVKNVRVAERSDQLGAGEEPPSGLLALQAALDMDLHDETWKGWIKGSLDSMPLGLPGPRFQAQVDGRLDGPWVQPLGEWQLPVGSLAFSRGRLFLGQQSLEGFEGRLETGGHALTASLNTSGKPAPFFTLQVRQKGEGLGGDLEVHLGPESADTANLATRLTKDLLKDAGGGLRLEGTWSPSGLGWQGKLANVVGRFEGFDLIQPAPADLKGDAAGGSLDLTLQGQAAGQGQAPVPSDRSAHLRLAGKVPFSLQQPVDLKLAGVAELAHLKEILDHVLQVDEYSLLADLKPQGNAQFDLRLAGPFQALTAEGLLSLRDGRLEVRTYPQSVEDLSFNLHFHDRDVVLLESDPLQG
ncbi:MAG TPA: hypothetical protein VN436_08255, partial [Holophaga sp.]|nr:hypothetical protein [Holophaga sp.]